MDAELHRGLIPRCQVLAREKAARRRLDGCRGTGVTRQGGNSGPSLVPSPSCASPSRILHAASAQPVEDEMQDLSGTEELPPGGIAEPAILRNQAMQGHVRATDLEGSLIKEGRPN